eukprot:746069-Hanusia_phi.AAC.2
MLRADSLDNDHNGLICYDEFCRLFEPMITRRASSSGTGTMDIDDLMKEAFNTILNDAKVRLERLLAAAHAEFRLSEVLSYKDSCALIKSWRGKEEDSAKRSGVRSGGSRSMMGSIPNLQLRAPMSKCTIAAEGKNEWLIKLIESDEEFRKEIKDPSIIPEYCKLWLAYILEIEKKEVNLSQHKVF